MIEFLWQRLLEFWGHLETSYHPIWDTLDILVVALALYWLLLLIRGTRAVQMVVGLMVLLAARVVSEWAQLATVGLILDSFFVYGVLIIIIIFQHDIRRALARMGRGVFQGGTGSADIQLLEEVVRAAQTLSQKRVGALIVLERETSLDDLVEAGVALDAKVTKELLTAIFLPYSPLHDGALVIQAGRVDQAGCVLPLTARTDLPEGVGTRHRAALGLTEQSDAVVVVVSEETAAISLVIGEDMQRNLDAPRLRAALQEAMAGEPPEPPSADGAEKSNEAPDDAAARTAG